MKNKAIALKAEGLMKTFGDKKILNDLSFQVEKGGIFSLLGPNGAGKTTLSRIILDILRPDSGSIDILGHPFLSETKERIGYLPEEGGLYKTAKIFDCIQYFAQLKGMEKVDATIDHWLKKWTFMTINIKTLRS